MAKTCVDQSQILWKRWRQLAIGAWTDLWWGELSSNLPASGIGHFIRQNQTPLLLTTYIHPSTQSVSQISNCFVLSTEKGKTYQPKRASIPCDNGQHCWETCNYTIQFHALSHLQSWMAGRQNFPRDSWTCSSVCPPPPPPCLANRYKSTEQMSRSSIKFKIYIPRSTSHHPQFSRSVMWAQKSGITICTCPRVAGCPIAHFSRQGKKKTATDLLFADLMLPLAT